MDEPLEEDEHKFPRADYVVVLPLEVDKYGMPTAESYKQRILVRYAAANRQIVPQ